MEKKFNFVYLTTNLINGKQYVGDHSTNDLNHWKTKNYLGSGIYLNNAKKKHGKENFKREILEFFSTKKEAFDAQERYIKEYNTLIPNGYNVSIKGGYGVPDSFLNEDTKKKIGNKNKGKLRSDEFKEYLRKTHTGKKQSNETVEKRVAKLKGKSHLCSKETKEKISKTNRGRILKEETKEKIRIYQTGKIRSEETKIKMSASKRKFNDDQIREILEKLKYMKILEIAKEYKVSRGIIDRIKKGLLKPLK